MGSCSSMVESSVYRIGVAMKWVSLRPEVNPLTGSVTTDDRWAGASPADLAALETALQVADHIVAFGWQRNQVQVTVATVGPTEASGLLKDSLSCGASNAVRIEPGLRDGEQPTSRAVAGALTDVFTGFDLVLCGDWSLDRGSASVPVFLAAGLGVDEACGLVKVELVHVELVKDELAQNEPAQNDGVQPSGVPASTSVQVELQVERRLDGGRRERLVVRGPAVLSVEGLVARIRRATLSGLLTAQTAPIDVRRPTKPMVSGEPGVRFERTVAFRPPAPFYASPSPQDSPLSRVADLMGVSTTRVPPARLELDPDAAADLIIERVRAFDASQ